MTALSGADVPARDIRQTISKIVRTVLERDDIDPAIDLFDQGATSLAFIQILAQIGEWYGILVNVMELEDSTINSLSAFLDMHRSDGNRPQVREKKC